MKSEEQLFLSSGLSRDLNIFLFNLSKEEILIALAQK
jgi:hypothetical protein